MVRIRLYFGEDYIAGLNFGDGGKERSGRCVLILWCEPKILAPLTAMDKYRVREGCGSSYSSKGVEQAAGQRTEI